MNFKKVILSLVSVLIMALSLTNALTASAAEDTAVYNFEGGFQGLYYNESTNVNFGNTILSLDKNIVKAGEYSLKLNFSGGQNKFRYRVDVPTAGVKAGQRFTINYYVPVESTVTQILIYIGYTGTTYPVNNKGVWREIVFEIAENHTNFSQFFIEFRMTNTSDVPASVAYLDSIHSEGLEVIPAFKKAEKDPTLYNFEKGIHDWWFEKENSTEFGVGELTLEDTIVYAGDHSLKVLFEGGFLKGRIRLPIENVTAGKTFTFKMYVPQGSLLNKIEAYTISPTHSVSHTVTAKDDWFTLSLTIPDTVVTVKEFFLNFTFKTGVTIPPSVIYIDSVHDGTPIQIPEEPMSRINVEIGQGGSVLLDANGTTSTFDTTIVGDFPMGTNLKLTAVPNEDYTFAYWANNVNSLVSELPTYECYVGSGVGLKAVFHKTPTEDNTEFTVVFKGVSGRILKTSTVAEGQAAVPPVNPEIDGYEFVGWDRDYSNVTSDMIINALYVRASNVYTVTVVNGTLSTGGVSGEYKFDMPVTVIADEAPAGLKFSHWVQDGNKVSDYTTHSFFVPMIHTTLTAVYVSETTVVEIKPFITISNDIITDPVNRTMSFIVTRSVPHDYTLIESGVLLLQSNEDPGEITLDTAGVLRGRVSNNSTNEFLVRKININPGDTWYARAYLIYKDKDGNIVTVYSGTVSKTME